MVSEYNHYTLLTGFFTITLTDFEYFRYYFIEIIIKTIWFSTFTNDLTY